MVKVLQISLVFAVLCVQACSLRSDYKYQRDDSTHQSQKGKDVRKDLSELEEPVESFDYSEAVNMYAHYLPGDISITKFRNFIVFSTLSADTTYNIIDRDIRWTIDAMKNNYIKTQPDKVTAVFLFSDFELYKNFSVNVFNTDEQDLSPYGFYRISKNVIVIKYVSWKGSPSHETTHAMLQNDFPDIPSWFNEGLASLHEKSTYKNGELIGDFSWRILSLRRAFNEDTYTGLNQLMTTNDDELYGKRSSFYYAQSRYLLMNLQQKGLLKEYYKNFRSTYEKDHTGITQLIKITGKSLDELDKELVDYIQSFKQEFR